MLVITDGEETKGPFIKDIISLVRPLCLESYIIMNQNLALAWQMSCINMIFKKSRYFVPVRKDEYLQQVIQNFKQTFEIRNILNQGK